MNGDSDEVVTHSDPVGRDRANFIIMADIEEPESPKRWEQLWARRMDDDRFEICCIPFFVYDVALGDIVRTAPLKNKQYVISELVASSGHNSFRVWFGGLSDPIEAQRHVKNLLADLNCRSERSSANLISIDAESNSIEESLDNALHALEAAGLLMYEIGSRMDAPRQTRE